jgi:lysine 6-dehydrogenase
MNQSDIVILGAGLMGRVAAYFFAHHPREPRAVRIADRDEKIVREAGRWLSSSNVEAMTADAASDLDLGRALEGAKVCVSCVPYFLNPRVARACLRAGVCMVDLGGNSDITDVILGMSADAKRRKISFIPDTGLAPGLANILAWELAGRFQKCGEVHIRVGGLPQEPQGPLKYAQFFSIHGLLNEYLEDAREIRDGKVATVRSLEECESLQFEGLGEFEAFITSGGTSTTPATLLGKVQRLDYKTIRYPGHCEALGLLRDLGLTETKKLRLEDCYLSPRDMLAAVLDEHLPKQSPDIVLVRVTATGDGGKSEKIELVVRQDNEKGLSAMGQLTAFPSAAIALAILNGMVPPGAHPQETVIPFAWMKEQLGLFGIAL